jgi:adenosylcobinamide-GDP ribazoletransferase
VVGAAIGLLQGTVAWAAARFLPAPVAAALTVAAGVLLSGGLHLDGLMDTADGLASGRPPREALEVMRDSAVGAYGIMAVCLVLLLQYSAALSLLNLDYSLLAGIYTSIVTLSRASLVSAICLHPYARSQGLGSAFRGSGKREAVGAWVTSALVCVALCRRWGPVLLAGSLALALTYGFRMARVFGGLTGDMYGALAEIEATILLLVAVALWT